MYKINKKQFKRLFQKMKNIFQPTLLFPPAHDGPTKQANGPTRRPGCPVFSHPPFPYPLLTDSRGQVKPTRPALTVRVTGGYAANLTGGETFGPGAGTCVFPNPTRTSLG
jgi:hypothetical protein